MDAPVKGLAPNSEKAKALQAALAQIEKQFGKGTIMRLGEGEGPAFGELDVEGPEAEIDRDGAVDGFEGRMRPTGKATAPEFVGAAVRGAGGGTGVSVREGHRIPWACISGT